MAEIRSGDSPNGYNLYHISELDSSDCPENCIFRNRQQPEVRRPFGTSSHRTTDRQRALHVAYSNQRVTTCDGWHPRRDATLQTGKEHNHLKIEELPEDLPCFNNGYGSSCGDTYGAEPMSAEELYRQQLRARSNNGYGEP